MVILKKIHEVRAQVKEWKKQGLTTVLSFCSTDFLIRL